MTKAAVTSENSENQIIKKLKEFGFFQVSEAIPELYEQAAQMSSRALLGKNEPRFACLPSFIPSAQADKRAADSLIFDIGGTSTKAGFRRVNNSLEERWSVLFEKKNRDLRFSSTDFSCSSALHEFALAVAQQTKNAFDEQGVSFTSLQLGIVWSNPMQSVPCSLGISAQVCERRLYNKGEWFISDLEDGVDIGSVFIEAFESVLHFRPQTLLIANDCPLTLKAGTESHGGIVASTGVNGTILAPSEQGEIVCNAEIGQMFQLNRSLITEYDEKPEDGLTNRIECLIGGRFLPRLLVRYIRGLSESGVACLSDLSKRLAELGVSEKWYYFRGKDLTFLQKGDFGQFVSRRDDPKAYSRETLECLQTLASCLIQRSAQLTSVVAIASVASCVQQDGPLRVAVDSRLAREVSFFWKILSESIHSQELLSSSIELELLEPLYTEKGSISVPMRGAANALDGLS